MWAGLGSAHIIPTMKPLTKDGMKLLKTGQTVSISDTAPYAGQSGIVIAVKEDCSYAIVDIDGEELYFYPDEIIPNCIWH